MLQARSTCLRAARAASCSSATSAASASSLASKASRSSFSSALCFGSFLAFAQMPCMAASCTSVRISLQTIMDAMHEASALACTGLQAHTTFFGCRREERSTLNVSRTSALSSAWRKLLDISIILRSPFSVRLSCRQFFCSTVSLGTVESFRKPTYAPPGAILDPVPLR